MALPWSFVLRIFGFLLPPRASLLFVSTIYILAPAARSARSTTRKNSHETREEPSSSEDDPLWVAYRKIIDGTRGIGIHGATPGRSPAAIAAARDQFWNAYVGRRDGNRNPNVGEDVDSGDIVSPPSEGSQNCFNSFARTDDPNRDTSSFCQSPSLLLQRQRVHTDLLRVKQSLLLPTSSPSSSPNAASSRTLVPSIRQRSLAGSTRAHASAATTGDETETSAVWIRT
ncbi:unnamed protein product, partial [Amoebophrya sp. A120]|eukprot:GSA120T00010784001.1